jgi:hypothetical protein
MKEFDDSFPPPLAMEVKRFRTARFDYQYERNGSANLFMMFAPLEGWRQGHRPPHCGRTTPSLRQPTPGAILILIVACFSP